MQISGSVLSSSLGQRLEEAARLYVSLVPVLWPDGFESGPVPTALVTVKV
jgi:hypothetical protein